MFSYFATASHRTVDHLRYFVGYLGQLASGSQTGFIRTMASGASSNGHHKFRNRLGNEKSPYLLQHASNPVDWYPWGNEAIEKAKRENKPIFLSVGYSTCHWCHVMERESFENETIGKVMNDHFVCIKVDREERPDVDRVYMTFIQATTGGGGWPMSVWLTPDLKPIVGGTYFPPDDRYYGRTGFKTILLRIAQSWENDKPSIEERGTEIMEALSKSVASTNQGEESYLPDAKAVDVGFQQFAQRYDKEKGGFGSAPKFPQPVNFNFMFRVYAASPESEQGKAARDMCLHTLRMMAKGGMYDHISKGFHRYSTDDDWHVPHFEKMLYDQSQLAVSYLDAYRITHEQLFADIACEILEYVNRDLSSKEGGFFSAEDADSLPKSSSKEKKEGAFCVWTKAEVQDLLSGEIEGCSDVAEMFCHHYGIQQEGNVDPYKDPHDELKLQNVLIVRGSLADTASKFNLPEETARTILAQCRQILYDARQLRPRPHLDDKMVTAWNGLMMSAFARAGQVLNDNAHTLRALQAAEFLHKHAYNEQTNTLLRSVYNEPDGSVAQSAIPIEAFADDYAFLIRGLLDLYEACFDERWIEWAEQLQRKQLELFWDSVGGGFFNSGTADTSIILRMKEDQDGAEPSANSVSSLNLLRLADFLDCAEWRDKAVQLMTVFGDRLEKIPIALPEMMGALMYLQTTPKQIIICGEPQGQDTCALLQCVHHHFLPHKVCIVSKNTEDGLLSQRLPVLKTMTQIDGKATAYVCQNYTCALPVTTVEGLQELLVK